MFLGPNAASPPKNTPSRVDWKVFTSTFGTSHLSNSMPRSRSIQGKAFSWPMARMTSSASMNSSPTIRSAVMAPFASRSYSITSKVMPFNLPFSSTKFFGERLMMILTCSSSASSSSHAEALKNWRGLRAMTFTSFAPRRSEVRQQSMAVLPTPMISTFSPMDLMCSNATDSSQVMPM